MTARVGYVLLWFPKASETFIHREAAGLLEMGLPLTVYTIYGGLPKNLSPAMLGYPGPIRRMGLAYLKSLPADWLYWLKRKPRLFLGLWREILTRRWTSLEMAGENLLCLAAGFGLARRALQDGVGHIHSPWACGPATAAWAAWRLTGIPFSFAGRAHDIFPPDAALAEKIRRAAFVRCPTKAAREQMAPYASGHERKLRLIYNSLTLEPEKAARVEMRPPYRLLAMGRMVESKGFDSLLRACRILLDQGLDFKLTLAGSGPRSGLLKLLARRLGLGGRVRMPGFAPHNLASGLFQDADVFVMPCQVAAGGARDGLPNVIMEALAHGVPVVAGDVAGVGELIKDGDTGLLVPPKDPDELARAMGRMLSDREAALGMAERGRAKVMAMFDPRVNLAGLADLFGRHSSAEGGRKRKNAPIG